MSHSPERALWLAVILQQFIDAMTQTTVHSRLTRSRLETADARKWLTGNSAGFRLVCEAAGVPASRVYSEARRQAGLGWPFRKLNLSSEPMGYRGVFS